MDRITLDKAINHLKVDNKLKKIIKKYSIPKFSYNSNYFDALSKSIIYQQLSGKVARIIYNRFLNLFPKKKPEPNYYLGINDADLKKIGLSKQKSQLNAAIYKLGRIYGGKLLPRIHIYRIVMPEGCPK